MTDMLPLDNVTILNSPDVRRWPITSEITHLALRDGTITLDHTKRGLWPAVPYVDTTQEATIWVFFKIRGLWYGTGGERLRPQQTVKELDQPSHIGPGWLYDIHRWGPMTNYVPQEGELVGFMVVAGISRGFGDAPVHERSAVVLLPFPNANGGVYPPWASVGGPIEPPAFDPAEAHREILTRFEALEAGARSLGHQADARFNAIDAALSGLATK
jgi:hypothetical protein